MQIYKHPTIFDKGIRQTFEQSPHCEADDVLLRFSDLADPAIGDELQCQWRDEIALLPAVKDIVFALMATVRGEQLGRVMVTRLGPGRRIYPHADTRGKYAHFYTRFHVPIVSEPGVLFKTGDETVNMAAGEVWWFNGHLEHSVTNNSARDRLNLIVDIKT